MTPTERLTSALRSLADALEGNGRHPLPCSDPGMPAERLLDDAADPHGWKIQSLVEAVVGGADAIDALCAAGLCDE